MQRTIDFTTVDVSRASKAFSLSSLPVNPRPFLLALYKGVEENGNEWLKTDEAKGIMWILNYMVHGDIATIEMHDEWNRLHEALKPYQVKI